MLCQTLEWAGIYNQAFRQAVLPDKAGQKYPSIHLGKQRYLLFFPNILTSCPVRLLQRIKNILIPLFGQTDIFAVFPSPGLQISEQSYCEAAKEAILLLGGDHLLGQMQCNAMLKTASLCA